MTIVSVGLAAAVLVAASLEQSTVSIPTSDVVKIAQIIARNEGYDVRHDDAYYFDVPHISGGAEMLPGYSSITFYINEHPRNLISISESTGQAVDMFSCEVFDYPELRPFQQQIMRITKAKRKTPAELAKDADCEHPVVLTKPVPVVPLN